MRKSFISELNKFIFKYGGISYFGEKKSNLINIVSPVNRLNFSVENLSYKENLTLQTTKTSGKEADILDKKIHEFAIICDKKTPDGQEKKKRKKNNI